jgi:hypothetical protein
MIRRGSDTIELFVFTALVDVCDVGVDAADDGSDGDAVVVEDDKDDDDGVVV